MHVLEVWSTTKATVALNSAAAELIVVVQGVSEEDRPGLGFQLCASTPLGIVSRDGSAGEPPRHRTLVVPRAHLRRRT